MTEENLPEPIEPTGEHTEDNGLCRNCQAKEPEPGYAYPLCAECRTKLAKTPIPKWVTGSLVVVGLLVVASSFKIGDNIRTAIHYEKGTQAIEARQYLTAQRELEQVKTVLENNTDVKAMLVECYYYNEAYEKLYTCVQELQGKSTNDNNLITTVNSIVDRMNLDLNPDTVLMAKLERIYEGNHPARIDTITRYLQGRTPDNYSLYLLADQYYESKLYPQCDSVCNILIKGSPTNANAHGLAAASAREQKQYDRAISIFQQILAFNAEDVPAMSGIVKVLLRKKAVNEAGAMVEQAIALEPENVYAMESKALWLHATGKTREATALLQQLKAQQTAESEYIYNRANDVVSGKVSY